MAPLTPVVKFPCRVEVVDNGRQGVVKAIGGLSPVGAAKDDYGPLDAALSEPCALFGYGHAERGASVGLKRARYFDVSVSVGVGLYNGHGRCCGVNALR